MGTSTKISILQPADTSWFDENPEEYLSRQNFQEYQDISGVDFQELCSPNPNTRLKAQRKLVSQTIIGNEIRNVYAGFRMPLLYYTHDLRLGRPVENHIPEVDNLWFKFDMGDSLRRRHLALSHILLPRLINEQTRDFGEPIEIANLGSGIGMDIINAASHTNGKIKQIVNYDLDEEAIAMGRKVTEHFERLERLNPKIMRFVQESLLKHKGKSHLEVMIGVICGLTNDSALRVLRHCHKTLHYGGKVIVSSSNEYMLNTDPLPSFIIQHLGKNMDPFAAWGLNCRTRETMANLFLEAGFKHIEVYEDANYPGRNTLPDEVASSTELELPKALGFDTPKVNQNYPSQETLDKRIGYNWLAIATK